ncbi:MAG: radical SAM protein [Planctomycetota bacterium]
MTEFEPNPTPSSSAPASTEISSRPGTPEASAAAEAQRRAESIHDFTAKLRQASLWPQVVEYLNWQRAQRKALAAGEAAPPVPKAAPLSINLDLTTACNYRCDHCIDWDILNSKDKHEDADLRAALREMAARGLRSVILIGGGEPTLYPGFVTFVPFLKELGLQVAIVSNGSRNDRILQIAPSLTRGDWVRLSLDSGTNHTFRAMHKPSRGTLDLDEICSWIARIREANADIDLGYSFIITWKGASRDDVSIIENIDEIVSATRRAREAGFNYISLKPFLERSADESEVMNPERTAHLEEVLRRIDAAVREARTYERPGFRVMESTNLRVLMRGNWRDYTNQPKTCHMQALRQVVTPIGTFNCPAYRGVERAKLGDKDLYSGPENADRAAGRTAQMVDQFDASCQCAEITCLYNGTNWWLEGLVESGEDLDALALPDNRGDAFL